VAAGSRACAASPLPAATDIPLTGGKRTRTLATTRPFGDCEEKQLPRLDAGLIVCNAKSSSHQWAAFFFYFNENKN